MHKKMQFSLFLVIIFISCNLPTAIAKPVSAENAVEADNRGGPNSDDNLLEDDISESQDLEESTSQTQPQPGDVLPYTSMNPPDLDLITISTPDEDGFVIVEGGPGAVPTEADSLQFNWVSLAGMEVGSEGCTRLNDDGSFIGQVYAPPGVTLYIAPAWIEGGPRHPDEEGGLCHQNSHGDGVLVNIPQQGEKFVAFGALPNGRERIQGEHNAYTIRRNFWRAQGDFSRVDITIRGLEKHACLRPALKIERLFDDQGSPRAVHDTGTQGVPVTTTGFMVESRYYWLDADVLYLENRECLEGQSDYDLTYDLPDFMANLADGWYRIRVILGGWDNGETWPFIAQNPFFSQEFEPALNDQGLYGPVFEVGDPATPYLPWVLFAETASLGAGGARGIVPTELKDDFAFDTRVNLTPTWMILPRLDRVSGAQVPYRLEPWLPSISAAPFRGFLPASPLIPLDPASSRMLVSITHPNGDIETLDTEALRQSVVALSFNHGGIFYQRPGANHSFAGPNRTYGMTTGDDSFVYIFPEDGLYSIQIDGLVSDIWGNIYQGGGTYQVYVAQALDIDMGVFMGTPMMVGDAYTPTLQVFPPRPADIEMIIRYFPYSDKDREVVHTITGRANRFGYFHPGEEPFVFDEPGEYRVDVLAQHVDANGDLWMAARTAASVVAEPDTSFTLHGDTQERGMRWYFNNVIHGGCGEESCGGSNVNLFPIFRGDIVWFADTTNQQRPSVFVSDPDGLTSERTHDDERRPLLSWSETGRDVYQYPEDATVWEYWYESAQRVGESIQQRVLQNETAHMHWYTSDNYNQQHGMPPDGDLVHDIKLLFGGAVHKGPEGVAYAYYAAMDVTIPELTDLGQRTCPPFQGAAGGTPNCGPILELKGRDVDLFLTPSSVQPGSIMEVGDTFAFSGIMWPTLDTKYKVTITKPDGSIVLWEGQATPVGYVSDEGRTFVVDQPGRYRIHLTLIHDAVVPSTGAAPDPPIIADGERVMSEFGYREPLSAIMGTFDSTFEVYAVSPDISLPPASVNMPGDSRSAIRVQIESDAPDGTSAYYTLHMPGFILEMGEVEVQDGIADIEIDRRALMKDYPNFSPEYEVYTLTLLVDDPDHPTAHYIYFNGNTFHVAGQ